MKTMRWKAPMPKDAPPDEMSHFVFAFKTSGGQRLEFSGKAMTTEMFIALRSLQVATYAAGLKNNREENII